VCGYESTARVSRDLCTCDGLHTRALREFHNNIEYHSSEKPLQQSDEDIDCTVYLGVIEGITRTALISGNNL